jgi:hypothetical protein
MSNVRRFGLDELVLRPGTYFNPQTEIMIVVDDTPEVDHELFDMDQFDSDDWVLIGEDTPVDEIKRDDLVERFQITYQAVGELDAGDDPGEQEPDLTPDLLDDEEDDDLEGVEEL